MKYLSVLAGCFLAVSFTSNAITMEALIRKNQKAAMPVFPKVDSGNFESLCKSASDGDTAAQEQLLNLQMRHIRSAYKPMKPLGGLLFSVRKPEKGYEGEENNYAANLDEFFDETSDDVRVNKKSFSVQTKTGESYAVTVLKYAPSEQAIDVKDGETVKTVPLSDLTDKDRQFVENALVDDQFKSSRELVISSVDDRLGEVASKGKDKVSSTHYLTGEKVKGSFSSASMKGISRRIILENKGNFPIEHLVVEYQSFIEQTVMKMPKDFPTDFRCVGYEEVGTLAPGEVKEIELELPETVDAKQESINTGEYEYSVVLPPDVNPKSEGRVNGVWVKVHRFTPYGERLTREYKSAGVPSAKWECVVPVKADIR
jgi:hypothetical protein